MSDQSHGVLMRAGAHSHSPAHARINTTHLQSQLRNEPSALTRVTNHFFSTPHTCSRNFAMNPQQGRRETLLLLIVTVHTPHTCSRNFAMNPQQGLRITKFSVADQRPEDGDLVHLEKYLVYIAKKTTDFSDLKHSEWKSTLAQIEETPES
jgi:hypothetical protein